MAQASTSRGSASIAADVPDAVHAKAKKKSMALQAQLRLTLEDPTVNPIEALMAEAEKWAEEVGSQESPLTQARRIKILSDWAGILLLADKDLSPECHWDRDVVLKYWDKFLYILVSTAKKQKRKERLKARTVSGWCGHFLHAIVSYTREQDGTECGLSLLIKEGLYQKLKAQLLQIIKDFNLDRHYNPKIYFGRAELQIVIDTMLDASRHTGRQVIIQNGTRFLFTFHFTLRGSSMGPTHKMWRELDYVLLCGHITIFCRGYMDWVIRIKVLNYKNKYSTVTGSFQEFTADGVMLAHNVLFDPTPWIMSHLFLLKRFKKPYETIAELCADQSAQIEIDPKYANTPFFLEAAPGGREFVEPHVAAMSRAASDSLRDWASKSDLPRVGLAGVRRESGNTFGLQLGTEFAKDILNHTETGVFRGNYSKNMGNFTLVNLRLGEGAGNAETTAGFQIKKNDQRHAFMGPALGCLLRRSLAEEAARAEPIIASKKKGPDPILDHPDLGPLTVARESAWNTYLLCFNATGKTYHMTKANFIFKLACGDETVKNPGKLPLAFLPPWDKATTALVLDAYLKANKDFLEKKKALTRRQKEDDKNDRNWAIIEGPIAGTAQQRNDLLRALQSNAPGRHLQQAVDDALAQVTPPPITDKAALETWAANLQTARSTVALLELTDGDGDDDDLGDQDRLYTFLDRMTLSPTAPEIAPRAPTDPPDNKGKGKATAQAPATNEEEDDSIFEGPPVDERLEVDVLNIPVADVRRAFLEYLVQPVLAARAYAKFKDEGEEGNYHCPKCKYYVHLNPCPDPVLDSIAKFERHILMCHSEWKDLELRMVKVEGGKVTYRCTAGDFEADTVAAVRKHAVSAFCASAAAHQAMKRVHEDEAPPPSTTYTGHENTRLGRANASNRKAGEKEKKGPAPFVDPIARAKEVIEAAVEEDGDSEADTVAQALLSYLDALPPDVNVPAAAKGKKLHAVGDDEWGLLKLDKLTL
ncbi:hypothetical protein C8R46DRAFT_1063178 [Mycena filopes]|nr:hypothetical protein C8R46DRAFT_1063178 [Mycena filopes]